MKNRIIQYIKSDKVYTIENKRFAFVNKNPLVLLLPAIILVLIGILCFSNSKKVDNVKSISYSETGNIDYKVYLKENNYYDTSYLEKDMQYIASLINTINVRFNYELHGTEKLDYKYSYRIIANLKVSDKADTTKLLYNKEETLKEGKLVEISDNNFVINEDIDIDYGKYNNYISTFRSEYGLSANAELALKMVIDTNGQYKEKPLLKNSSSLSMTIPLSEQTINIKMDTNSLNQNGTLKLSNAGASTNLLVLIPGIISMLLGITLAVFSIYKYIRKVNSDPYRKELNRILKEYDANIVTATSSIRENSSSVVRVPKFEELLDAQSQENKPIIFYEVDPDNKSYFIINGENTTYRFTLTRAYQERLKAEKETFEDNIK